MEHLVNRISEFIENVPKLKGERYREEIYNYVLWSLLRHIDYSVCVKESVKSRISYYTMSRLYKELCERNNVKITLGFMCCSSCSLKFLESKLNIGSLYLFYLSHLEMSEEFKCIALEFLECVDREE